MEHRSPGPSTNIDVVNILRSSVALLPPAIPARSVKAGRAAG
jgi:hypothetical protein